MAYNHLHVKNDRWPTKISGPTPNFFGSYSNFTLFHIQFHIRTNTALILVNPFIKQDPGFAGLTRAY